jgi:acyl transferase domain-containing protein/acyl carrier protein
MNAFKHRISNLTPKQLILLADNLNTRLEKAGQAAAEPLAVIGLGCRFPGGADNPALYWNLLADGREGICEVPPDRWDIDAYFDPDPDLPGKMNTRMGGFLRNIDEFDADFFGISPREAVSMDPQQRLLLEVSWETLENANVNPRILNGSATGVFVGICNSDYHHLLMQGGESEIDAYLATGSAHSIAAGRISYCLGLQGPSISTDTACSSSLVAVHLACQSLRAGECRLALAGGVNLMLSPETTIALTKSRMMSPGGRCRTFDKDADGFVRGEGCGMVALKRLSHAQSDGDNIIALILGSAANQDGRSSGITAPNGPSQAVVIQKALSHSGLKPADIDYIEAHGTGTSLGDPIEMGALADVFGPGNDRAEPLLVGSVKTNIGHGESAAGIAGLIKLILAVNKGQVPPHLQYNAPNPAIDWDRFSVRIPVEREPWPQTGGRRIGGVSSFGFSGTNAHMIVAEPPASTPAGQNHGDALQLIAISAREGGALRDLAGRYADFLTQRPQTSFFDFSRILATGRAHHTHRAAFTARSLSEAAGRCDALKHREKSVGIHCGTAGKHPMQPVFLFTGQGVQYPGMGRALYQTEPVFRRAFDRCDPILRPLVGRGLLELLDPASATPSELDRTRYTQPVLFALEYALACLWRAWGIEPAAVMGHSVGEYVAACIAGLFSLEEGLRLIARRGSLMQQLPDTGAMAAVSAPAENVRAYVDGANAAVSIAADNSPDQTVVSGGHDALTALLSALERDGIGHQRLRVSHGFHSHLMDPMLDDLAAEAASIKFSNPQIPIISNLTGAFVEDDTMGRPGYWCDHTRRTVQFASGMRAIHGAGHRHFLEIGPHPLLTALGRQCLSDESIKWYHTLRKGRDDHQEILDGLAALYVGGADVQWDQVVRPAAATQTALPTYPFRRKKYWPVPNRRRTAPAQAPVSGFDQHEPVHHLLGRPVLSPALAATVFESRISSARPAFMDHHRVFGACIMPTPAYLEMAMAVSEKTGLATKDGGWDIGDIRIEEALILPDDEAAIVQTVFESRGDGNGECRFFSRISNGGETAWRRHATCRIQHPAAREPAGDRTVDIGALHARCSDEMAVDAFYGRLEHTGLMFGSCFRGIEKIRRGDHEALGEMALPEELVRGQREFCFHPALLDACFHLLGAAMAEELHSRPYLLIGMDRFRLYRTAPARFWNSTRLRPAGRGAESLSGEIVLFDADGNVIGRCDNLLLKRAHRDTLLALPQKRQAHDLLYSLTWHAKALPGAAAHPVPPPQGEAGSPVEGLTRCLERHAETFGLDVYQSLLPELDRYSRAAIVRAMQQAGIGLDPGETWTLDRLEKQLGMVPRYRRLLGRMAAILVEGGIFKQASDRFVVAGESRSMEPAVSAEELVRRYPVCEAQIRLTQRCADPLGDVLQGRCDPLDLLFPEGRMDALDSIYRDAPYARAFNAVLCDGVISEITRRQEAAHPIRILEIGAGTGGTTAHLLPLLAGKKYRYRFTDIGPLFLTRAREHFGGDPFVAYEILDIEKDPREQGFVDRRFDIVIAANVLHATRNLKETTSNVRKLMAPGGTLILLEGTAPQAWVDLTFGLTEGWWRFEDADLRTDYALIDRHQWEDLLAGQGLNAFSVALDESHPGAGVLSQALIVARKPANDADAHPPRRSWIVPHDNGGSLREALLSRIEASGDELLKDTGKFTVLEQALEASGDRSLNIVYFWDAPQWKAPPENPGDALNPVLDAVRDLLGVSSHHHRRPKLWIVTTGAQPVHLSDPVSTPLKAGIWGLMRVFALEHPDIFGGIVDLDPDERDEVAADYLFAQLLSDDGEDQTVFRSGRRYVPRIERVEHPDAGFKPVELQKKAAYLITGGLGGLGVKIAKWMSAQGAGRIVLVSRKALPPRSQWRDIGPDHPAAHRIRSMVDIEAGGARVETVAADAGDRAAMEALFLGLGKDRDYPLRGIVHLAARMSARPIEDLSKERLGEMMGGKARGALLLDEFSRGMELDFFVMFSSTTSLWGASGLAHYAAANQVLDALAHRRHHEHLPGVSINWGTWEEMRVAGEKEKKTFRQAGLNPIPVNRALALLGRHLDCRKPQICIADVNWQRLLDVYEARKKRPLFSRVTPAAASPSAPAAPHQGGDLKRALEAASTERWTEILTTHLKGIVRQVLHIESDDPVITDRGLFEMGMDSLMAVELKGRLEKETGLSLPSTLTFNYPTIDDLTGFLMDQLAPCKDPLVPKVEGQAGTVPKTVPEAETTSDYDALSEDQLSALLTEKLERLK